MNSLYLGILKRAFRAAMATGAPMLIQYYTDVLNPWIMTAMSAALMGLGKLLRDKLKLPNVPV